MHTNRFTVITGLMATGVLVTLLSAAPCFALDGNGSGPMADESGERQNGRQQDARSTNKPRLIIRGKNGQIIDVQGSGITPAKPRRKPEAE